MSDPKVAPEGMPKEKFLFTQITLLNIGRLMKQIELEAFVAQIDKALLEGPSVDPELMKKALANMQTMKAFAEAIIPVKKAFDETIGSMIKTAARSPLAVKRKPMPPPNEDARKALAFQGKGPTGDEK